MVGITKEIIKSTADDPQSSHFHILDVIRNTIVGRGDKLDDRQQTFGNQISLSQICD
jgi:hypothetical protein